jgi:hypothetical protein
MMTAPFHEGLFAFGIEPGSSTDDLPLSLRVLAILAPAEYDAWLRDGGLDLLRPFAGEMYAYLVDKALLKDRDVPECLAELSAGL